MARFIHFCWLPSACFSLILFSSISINKISLCPKVWQVCVLARVCEYVCMSMYKTYLCQRKRRTQRHLTTEIEDNSNEWTGCESWYVPVSLEALCWCLLTMKSKTCGWRGNINTLSLTPASTFWALLNHDLDTFKNRPFHRLKLQQTCTSCWF